MKVYIASSYKTEKVVKLLGEILREMGHDTYVFCDVNEPACKVSMAVRSLTESQLWDAKEALSKKPVQEIYVYDMAKLKPADCVLLVLPCGKSSHIEAGYKKGQGKSVVVYGATSSGDWDTMYLMFDAFFTTEETKQMFAWFKERSPNPNDSAGGSK